MRGSVGRDVVDWNLNGCVVSCWSRSRGSSIISCGGPGCQNSKERSSVVGDVAAAVDWVVGGVGAPYLEVLVVDVDFILGVVGGVGIPYLGTLAVDAVVVVVVDDLVAIGIVEHVVIGDVVATVNWVVVAVDELLMHPSREESVSSVGAPQHSRHWNELCTSHHQQL